MKKWTLILTLVLCLALTAGAFAEERAHLTVGIAEMPQVIDFETNRMTQLLEEEGNLDLDFVTYVGSEMIEKLNLYYNRARQASITQELTEIIAGANAIE